MTGKGASNSKAFDSGFAVRLEPKKEVKKVKISA
jgi:hypothetical protein